MEKTKGSFAVQVATLVEVTPTQLREIATLMESSAGKVMPNETTMIPLTDRIWLTFTGKVSTTVKTANEIKGNVESISMMPRINN